MKIQEKRDMVKKHKSRFRILWYILPVFALLAVSVIVIPPMIHLNFLEPRIENVIFSKTGIPVKIHGNINVSLLGRATIVAHNISTPNGVISSCKFSIPFFDIFDIRNAKISKNIIVNGASLFITKIEPFNTDANITINNSKIKFLNKEYKIINANFSKTETDAIIRTDQHKYEIQLKNNEFIIKNHNNNLKISGKLLPSGDAIGHLNIVAQDINRWFEFDVPRIPGRFPIEADVKWNGNYGIVFYNISADGITGSVEWQEDGYKVIKLKSNTADYDMSFLLNNSDTLKDMSLDLDFYGKLKLGNKTFKHLQVKTIGSKEEIKIDNVIVDDINIRGGTIDENGAHNVYIAGPLSGLHTTCLFNGTLTDWSCKEYSHGNDITSVFSVKDDVINADVYSTAIYADMKPFVVTIRKLASSGEVRFYYPDMEGTLHLKKDSYTVDYTRMDNKSLNQAKINPKFLPDFMKNEPGDFVWLNGVMIFTANSKQWQLSKSSDFFILRGENFKKLAKEVDLQSLNDLPFVLSGNYKDGNIYDFTLEIAGHKITGILTGKSATLKTDILNADLFINKSFLQKFEELSFFTNHPILLPFESGLNIALYANKIIYQDTEYDNFVYSLHKNIQKFSISDSNRGNLLATIKKDNAKYNINIMLNKFLLDRKILPNYATLNLDNTTITAEINLNTIGTIGHDIINNLNGTFDALFVGGDLYGLGFDEFYALAPSITTLNVEERLIRALNSGTTKIKNMHIVGTYDKGNIKTTSPLTLSMKHINASGMLEIKNDNMFVKLDLLLRGISTDHETIALTIDSFDNRNFSLSEIMMGFDPEYMRTFVQTHDKF